MRFYTLEEKKPKYGERILAKLSPEVDWSDNYYVVCRTIKSLLILVNGEWEWKDQDVYEEAMGEQYACWKEKEIIGWTSFNEIKKAEKWQESGE